MNWKKAYAIPGVSRLLLLRYQFRVRVTLKGGPSHLDVRIYENDEGRFEAQLSHRPAAAPIKPGLPRPVTARLPAKPATTRLVEAPVDSFATAEAALEHGIQWAIARRAPSWEPNPAF